MLGDLERAAGVKREFLRGSATLWFWRPGLDAPGTIELPNATLDGWLLSAQSMVLVPRAWSLSTAPAPAS